MSWYIFVGENFHVSPALGLRPPSLWPPKPPGTGPACPPCRTASRSDRPRICTGTSRVQRRPTAECGHMRTTCHGNAQSGWMNRSAFVMMWFWQRNSCIIDGICYREDETSPHDHCLVCKAIDDEYQWTTVSGMSLWTPIYVLAQNNPLGI